MTQQGTNEINSVLRIKGSSFQARCSIKIYGLHSCFWHDQYFMNYIYEMSLRKVFKYECMRKLWRCTNNKTFGKSN